MTTTTELTPKSEVLPPKPDLSIIEPDAPMCTLVMSEGGGFTVFGTAEALWKAVMEARAKGPLGFIAFERAHAPDKRRVGFIFAREVRSVLEEGSHSEYWEKKRSRGGLAGMLGLGG